MIAGCARSEVWAPHAWNGNPMRNGNMLKIDDRQTILHPRWAAPSCHVAPPRRHSIRCCCCCCYREHTHTSTRPHHTDAASTIKGGVVTWYVSDATHALAHVYSSSRIDVALQVFRQFCRRGKTCFCLHRRCRLIAASPLWPSRLYFKVRLRTRRMMARKDTRRIFTRWTFRCE